MVGKAISGCRTHQEMLNKAATVIGKIADTDDTVNHNIQALVYFEFRGAKAPHFYEYYPLSVHNYPQKRAPDSEWGTESGAQEVRRF